MNCNTEYHHFCLSLCRNMQTTETKSSRGLLRFPRLGLDKYWYATKFMQTEWSVVEEDRGKSSSVHNVCIDVVYDSLKEFLKHHDHPEATCNRIILGKLLHEAGVKKVKRGPRKHQKFFYFPLKAIPGSCAELLLATADVATYSPRAPNVDGDESCSQNIPKDCNSVLLENSDQKKFNRNQITLNPSASEILHVAEKYHEFNDYKFGEHQDRQLHEISAVSKPLKIKQEMSPENLRDNSCVELNIKKLFKNLISNQYGNALDLGNHLSTLYASQWKNNLDKIFYVCKTEPSARIVTHVRHTHPPVNVSATNAVPQDALLDAFQDFLVYSTRINCGVTFESGNTDSA